MTRVLLRCLALAVALVIVLVLAPAAGAQSSTQSAGDSAQNTKDKKDKSRDKDKKKQDKGDDEVNTSVFSARVAEEVLGMVRDGLEGHSQRLMLSAFDGDKMDGYLTFEDQVQALFDRYEGFRAHFRIVQQSSEKGRGVVLAIFDLEELPRGGRAPLRKSEQVRFELERGRKGWRIVDYSPRDFFS